MDKEDLQVPLGWPAAAEALGGGGGGNYYYRGTYYLFYKIAGVDVMLCQVRSIASLTQAPAPAKSKIEVSHEDPAR